MYIYAEPENIVPETLTHILYCFADIADSGEAKLTDNYADEQIHYPGDTWDTAGNIVSVIPKGSVICALMYSFSVDRSCTETSSR
jgi:GH18 family chitinase